MPIDEYLRRCDGIVDEFERMKEFSVSDTPLEVHKSHEYGSTIIHSIVTGTPSVVYGNMPNNGVISNLPDNAIVEAPTLVDRAGLQLTRVGALPVQLAAYMQPHVAQHELFIQAAMESKREAVYQAAMFDPLTAATLTLDQIVEMCDELIAGHGDLLPPLNAPTLVPTSGKAFSTVDPRDLRASWDAEQAKKSEDAVKDWHIIGPFRSESPETVSLEFATPIDALAVSPDGLIDLHAAHACAAGEFAWRSAAANSKSGIVDLSHEYGAIEGAVAFAYVEIASIHAGKRP